MKIKIKKLHPDAIIPKYATPGAACFDLHLVSEHPIAQLPGGYAAVLNTGLSFEIPDGHVMLIFSRSGHGFKNNVRLANSTGVIDSDYRGEVMVKLINDGDAGGSSLVLKSGDRIAQAMVIPIQQVKFVESEELTETERGQKGLGSTGA